MPEPEVKLLRRGRWTRALIEADGEDVSHLGYAPYHLAVGPAVSVRLAGIGGVGTRPQFRRRGFAGRVFARAMEEIRRERYSCVGLYTGTDIVAHRLYRRFGFVGLHRPRPATKLLDPAEFVARKLSAVLAAAAERGIPVADWRCSLELRLDEERPFHLQIESGRARALPRRPRKSDLALSSGRGALLQMCYGGMTRRFAEAAGLLRWQGDEQHWQRLSAALDSHHNVVNQGVL